MKQYNLRPNRPKTGDGSFIALHLGNKPHQDDAYPSQKKRGPAKSRWLRGIYAHLQQAIMKSVNDRASGQLRTVKIPLSNNAVIQALTNLGIEKKWIPSPALVEILQLQTEFIKDNYLKVGSQLQFKLVTKVLYYFDKHNNGKKTDEAVFLRFRLLKNTPVLQNLN